MVYRIDVQHFLADMIDYFTREDLLHFNYVIVSAKVMNYGRQSNVAKAPHLYPTTDMITSYAEFRNKDMLENVFMEYLLPSSDIPKKEQWINNVFYDNIINPYINHKDVVLICDRDENLYVDILCKALKKRYKIEVIDLNELFIKGEIGPIKINRSESKRVAVDIRRTAELIQMDEYETTRDGREYLLSKMTKKDKLRKLKKLGISVAKSDEKDLDELLIDSWVNDIDD